MNRGAELYDYEEIRTHVEPVMFRRPVQRSHLVMGSAQSASIIHQDLDHPPIVHRRGGGGVVWLRPGDAWVDFWFPASDERGRLGVHATAMMVGSWWAGVLAASLDARVEIHDGALRTTTALRAVCFASVGPGEVSVDSKKAVGLTQWRVREGNFVSTVLHRDASVQLTQWLSEDSNELAAALEHASLLSLRLSGDATRLIDQLALVSGPWSAVVTTPLL